MVKRKRADRTTWGLVAAGVAAAVCLLAVPFERKRENVEALILRLVLNENGFAAVRVERELVALGTDTIDPMFTSLVKRKLGERALDAGQLDLLKGALTAFGPSALGRHLGHAVEADDSTETVIRALELLAPIARDEDFTTFARIAAGGREPEGVAPVFTDSVTGLLRREKGAFVSLPGVWRSLPHALQLALIDSVRDAKDARGLEFLADNIGFDDVTDGLLLDALVEIARVAKQPGSRNVTAAIRRFLHGDVGDKLNRAVIALGLLQDESAVGDLIDLLDTDSRGLQRGVNEALQRITGISFHGDHARWSAWYESELEWFDGDGADTLAALQHAEASMVLSATRVLAKHKLFRQRISRELALLLNDPDAAVRSATCLALSQLGSSVAVPALIDALQDENESVARNAYSALRALTGRNDPVDSEAWQKLADELAATS